MTLILALAAWIGWALVMLWRTDTDKLNAARRAAV